MREGGRPLDLNQLVALSGSFLRSRERGPRGVRGTRVPGNTTSVHTPTEPSEQLKEAEPLAPLPSSLTAYAERWISRPGFERELPLDTASDLRAFRDRDVLGAHNALVTLQISSEDAAFCSHVQTGGRFRNRGTHTPLDTRHSLNRVCVPGIRNSGNPTRDSHLSCHHLHTYRRGKAFIFEFRLRGRALPSAARYEV